MRHLVVLLTALTTASALIKVPIVKKTVWREKVNGIKIKKMAAVCTFTIPKTQFRGNWEVNVTLNRPTNDIKIWIMDVKSRDSNGFWYFTRNKYDYGPQTINMEFQLEMDRKAKLPRGKCITNLPKPLVTTPATAATTPPTFTSITQSTVTSPTPSVSGNIVPIVVDNSWSGKMKGICLFTLDQPLDDFHFNISLSESTSGLQVWAGKVVSSESNGKWYYLKNNWKQHPPTFEIVFIVRYFSTTVPSGTCSIDKLSASTAHPQTNNPSTAMPSTSQPPATASTNQPPATLSTNQPPATSPTNQPPGTASTNQPPATASTNQPPATESTNQPPATASVTPPPTSQPTTAAPNLNTKYDYKQALNLSIMFYEAQRSGKLPANNRIHYRGDSALNDKADDGSPLTGGWYDAGDGVKFNFPMASSTTLLAWGLSVWKDAYVAANQIGYIYDSLRWPLDYFLKCWKKNKNIYYAQVGNGDIDHAYWGRHEEMNMKRPAYKITTSKPGSDVAGETAAAFAAGYLAFVNVDRQYADRLLDAAKSLFAFALKYRGKYSDAIPDAAKFYKSFSGYQDELCFSAALLYKATNNPVYLQTAKDMVSLSTSWALSWDDKTVACQALLYDITNDSKYGDAIQAFINSYLPGAIAYTPDGLAWRMRWGSNRYAANAAFIALMATEMGIGNAAVNKNFATKQINFMLGDNKYNMSYVVGFGSSYPLRPHHRASSCPSKGPCGWKDFSQPGPNPQILYGALVGGPDQSGNYQDKRNDFIMNEVACDYNAGFQSALAGLIHFSLKGQL